MVLLNRKRVLLIQSFMLIGVLLFSLPIVNAQIVIPVAVHILRDDNGNNARATSAEADTEISNLNSAYNYLNISFTKCSENFIDNTHIWYQFDDGDSDEKLLLDPYCISNVVNLFITDLEGGGHGKAVFPYKQKDWVLIDYRELGTTTVVHEFGHYFGLKHTYSGVKLSNPASSSSLTISDAEGPNGWKFGDFLIDTPLDPGNRDDYDNNCNYTGSQKDYNGDTFHPDGKNYMGKGHNYCRSRFSEEQEARILEYIKRYRYYLKCNDTGNNNLKCSNSISITSFPNNDDFDRDDVLNKPFWVQAREGDDMNWRNGPWTSSGGTGPSGAQSGQTFMYFEASLKYTNADKAILLSPCYDFSNVVTARIEFYYHMYGSDTGTLNLDVSTDDGASWTNIFTKNGQQHASSSAPWTLKSISLNDYIGQKVQLRFVAIGTGHSKSDIAIDNVTVSAQVELSIELLNFNAKVLNNKSVKLSWQTASEVNNDYFIIEHSKNGLDWKEIDKIDGAGNSSSLLNYSTYDLNPFNGISYYRLKQIDFDGNFSYSNIVNVDIHNLSNNNIEIYPNPTTNKISIRGNKSELEEIRIFNFLGQDVTKLTSITKKHKTEIIIDLSNLNNGMYLVKTKTTAKKVYKK